MLYDGDDNCWLSELLSVSVQVIFSMDNGQGEIASVYSPTSSSELCDGLWHRITGSSLSALPCDRHLRNGDPLEDKTEDYQNHSCVVCFC